MAFELKQNLKLAQQLIMTPQLQQAIKLLQLSRLELVDAVQQELEENPMLEEAPVDEESEDDLQPEVEEIRAAERPAELTGEGDGKEEFDWDSYLEDYGPSGFPTSARRSKDRRGRTSFLGNLLLSTTSRGS